MLYRIQNISARAIMYLIPIGGLLFLLSAVVWYSWNHFLHPNSSFNEITFLEAFGIVAIGYVGYSAVAFACDESSDCENEIIPRNKQALNTKTDQQTEIIDCKIPKHVEQLSPEEKLILREKIARCCGDVCKADSIDKPSHSEKELILTR
ncbi:MAG: hypothetical protein JST20_01970 [Bacteroidetes bacterium]|nr:hypothetical protein [Bacteroidota bacterium]